MATDLTPRVDECDQESELRSFPERFPTVEAEPERPSERHTRWLSTKPEPHAIFCAQHGIWDYGDHGQSVRSEFLRMRYRWPVANPVVNVQVDPASTAQMEDVGPKHNGSPMVMYRSIVGGPTHEHLADLERDFFKVLHEHYRKEPPYWVLKASQCWGIDLDNDFSGFGGGFWYRGFQRVNQVQSDVPRTCRRGWTTDTVVSPYMLWLLDRCDEGMQDLGNWPRIDRQSDIDIPVLPGSILTPVGRYRGKGDSYIGRLYVCHEWADDAPVIVSYRGTSYVDGGPFLIKYQNGEFGLELPDEHNDSDSHYTIPWLSYFSAMRVEPFRPEWTRK
jgi:hypothetical protein